MENKRPKIIEQEKTSFTDLGCFLLFFGALFFIAIVGSGVAKFAEHVHKFLKMLIGSS
jgi:hypothetical protein